MKKKRIKATGTKNDQNKPDMSLLPYESLVEVVKALEYGKNLYGRKNWQSGISYTRLISASLRHIHKFNEGIEKDEDSGHHHLGHAICSLLFLLWQEKHRKDCDDR